MNEIPQIIEASLLLLFIFLIGCVIGWFLRAKIFRSSTKNPSTEKFDSKPKSAVAKAPKPVAKPTLETVKTAPKASEPAQAVAKPDVQAPPAPKGRAKSIAKPAATKPKKAAIAPNPKPKTPAKSKSNTPAAPAGKPKSLSKPKGGKKDDLKKIKGVGPKLEGTLNGLGIYHFSQIAQWKRSEIDWVDDYLSFKGRIDRDAWIAQAKKLS